VKALDERAVEDLKRVAAALAKVTGDRNEAASKKREQLAGAWVKARDLALGAIFDRALYPDEDHGRTGQPIVTRRVDAVRDVWRELDPLLAADAARWQAVPEAKARELVGVLDDARARRAAGAAFLAGESVGGAGDVRVGAGEEALARCRGAADAGDERELGAFVRALLARVRDLRVEEENVRIAGEAPAAGKRPTADELELVGIANDYRAMLGRAHLEIDARLVASARAHSEEMTRLRYFEHESPVKENELPEMRMQKEGYPSGGFATGENLAETVERTAAAKEPLRLWVESAPHHRNLLDAQWIGVGVGRDGKHWTQDLGAAPGRVRR
jgi:hypothetical protein